MSHGTGGVVTFMEEDTRRPYFASHFQLKPVSRPTPPPPYHDSRRCFPLLLFGSLCAGFHLGRDPFSEK